MIYHQNLKPRFDYYGKAVAIYPASDSHFHQKIILVTYFKEILYQANMINLKMITILFFIVAVSSS